MRFLKGNGVVIEIQLVFLLSMANLGMEKVEMASIGNIPSKISTKTSICNVNNGKSAMA